MSLGPVLFEFLFFAGILAAIEIMAEVISPRRRDRRAWERSVKAAFYADLIREVTKDVEKKTAAEDHPENSKTVQ